MPPTASPCAVPLALLDAPPRSGARMLPGGTRRALDRLARRAHAFHRFAHHPLCRRYASELIPLGRRSRLCRGCACAALGTFVGMASACAGRPGATLLLACGAAGLALAFGSLVLRLPKALGRGLSAALVSFAVVAGLARGERSWQIAALLALGVGAAFLRSYRRRGPNRAPCQSCPERSLTRVCSGLRPIVQRERAFRRVAQRRIDAALRASG